MYSSWKGIKNRQQIEDSCVRLEGKNADETNRFFELKNFSNVQLSFMVIWVPFLVLGLKAGLLANSLLGKDCFEMKAVVITKPCPPTSCFVDGVQFATGCTMGKRNIRLRKGKSTSAVSQKNGRTARLGVKNEVLESVNRIASEDESHKESLRLWSCPASRLFKVEK
jgi:formylmethanofuran dehydrogenase subunit E